MIASNIQAQEWIDKSLYPFDSHFLELENGKLHYIDEGKGEILLFVHGTPTWSFLYRDFIKELSKSHRCIAVDNLGFGLSQRNDDFQGTPEEHAKNLSEFIRRLKLKNITLVVHDFGGPIGLSAALDMPNRINRIILFNSWLWATADDPMAQQIDGLLNSKEGEAYYLEQNYSVQVLLKEAFVDKAKLTEKIHNHYIGPFPNSNSREALLNIGKGFVGSSDWYESKWQELDRLAKKDWLILWGTKDPFLNASYLEKWRSKLPEAQVVELETGHFVQEEKTLEALQVIKKILK
mgnify:CR=1 FL=1